MASVMCAAKRVLACIGPLILFIVSAAGHPASQKSSLLAVNAFRSASSNRFTSSKEEPPSRFNRIVRSAGTEAGRLGKKAVRGDGDDDNVLERPGVQPKFTGHRLDATELAPIYDVECLKAKQKNPKAICANNGGAPTVPQNVPDLAITTYPNWNEPRCRSHGEYLCDPDGLLQDGQRTDLAAQIQNLRELTPVPCIFHGPGNDLSGSRNEGDAGRERRSFNLGVAFAKNWPDSEVDSSSLQQFGMVTMANWQMQELYNGVQVNYATCPTAALLIILPDIRQAFLASPSCEFICNDRGGQEVVTATLAALDVGGPYAAAAAGVQEAKRVLSHTRSMSRPLDEGHKTFEDQAKAWQKEVGQSEEVWGNAQRILFVVVVGSCLLGLLALASCVMAPPGTKDALKSAVF